ncbi:MAG: RNA-binding protein [Peptococcaceae bacterium]|jgi:RNA recognition motif-containing protein|nr:RNA-binding protein [Peptococcaceae bacterium]
MTSTLYVGNLPWNTTAEDLSDFFSQYGSVVSSRIITNRETGRSRGFGFIEVEEEDVERLTAELNGKELDGRPLTVNEAKPKPM